MDVDEKLDGRDGGGPPRRNTALDGVRGLAALSVALAHCVLSVSGLSAWNFTLFQFHDHATADVIGRLAFVAFPGEGAVTLFFVLSGHVLWESLFKKYARSLRAFADYAVSRLYRLLPVSIVSSMILGALSGGASPPISAQTIVASMLFLTTSINGVLWSLQVEMVLSLVLFAAWVLVGRSILRHCAALLLSMILLHFFDNLYVLFSVSFFAGALIGRLPATWMTHRWAPWVGLALLAGASVVVGHTWVSRYLETIGAFFIVSHVGRVRPAILSSGPVHFLGAVSYPFYLLHPVGVQLAAPVVAKVAIGPITKFASLATLSIALALALAWLVHVAVEMPVLRGRPKLWPRLSSA